MKKFQSIRIYFTGLLFLFCITGVTAAEEKHMLSVAGLETWLMGYETAWETRDGSKAASLFTRHATYRASPWEEPFAGRDAIEQYWNKVTANQRNIDFGYEIINVFDSTGIVHWTAVFNGTEGDTLFELNGIFVLEFETSGLCKRLLEWWHFREKKPEG